MAPNLTLPPSVVGSADVARLKRSLEAFDEQEHQAHLRHKAGEHEEVLQPSRLLQEVAALNDKDLQHAADRKTILALLDELLKNGVTVTISFAVDPSPLFMNKLVEWLRANIAPNLLVRVGLQPNIAAGCIVRTPSKIYDFSLRKQLDAQRSMLVDGVKNAGKAKVAS